uniref:Spondin domain-containing protein n=1 Tax=Timema tahoe TaxID=61484 RepID=A0A7R9FFH6_9NEOP|nr:unnamed protein product [Timema tahoe]
MGLRVTCLYYRCLRTKCLRARCFRLRCLQVKGILDVCETGLVSLSQGYTSCALVNPSRPSTVSRRWTLNRCHGDVSTNGRASPERHKRALRVRDRSHPYSFSNTSYRSDVTVVQLYDDNLGVDRVRIPWKIELTITEPVSLSMLRKEERMRSKILVAMAVLLVCAVAAKDACHGDNLAVYNLTLQTNWTEKLFPKHFPEWRPPAQWSGLARLKPRNTPLCLLNRPVCDVIASRAEVTTTSPPLCTVASLNPCQPQHLPKGPEWVDCRQHPEPWSPVSPVGVDPFPRYITGTPPSEFLPSNITLSLPTYNGLNRYGLVIVNISKEVLRLLKFTVWGLVVVNVSKEVPRSLKFTVWGLVVVNVSKEVPRLLKFIVWGLVVVNVSKEVPRPLKFTVWGLVVVNVSKEVPRLLKFTVWGLVVVNVSKEVPRLLKFIVWGLVVVNVSKEVPRPLKFTVWGLVVVNVSKEVPRPFKFTVWGLVVVNVSKEVPRLLKCIVWGLVVVNVSKEVPRPFKFIVWGLVVVNVSKEVPRPPKFTVWGLCGVWLLCMSPGRSHAPSYQLFRVGRTASEGLKLFAETGRSHLLELENDAGVLDQFSGSPVPSGQGTSSTRFFVDSAHSRVSAVVRLVPSPDWFVGLDSVELCSRGYWLDSISIQVGPIDAGSDNGLTFTSPDWSSEPPGPVNLITAHSPKHPAGSFFYPDIQELPVLATFHLHKDKVYRLSETQSNNVQPLEEVDNTVKQREMSNDVSFILPFPRVDKIRRSRRCRASTWNLALQHVDRSVDMEDMLYVSCEYMEPCIATCGQVCRHGGYVVGRCRASTWNLALQHVDRSVDMEDMLSVSYECVEPLVSLQCHVWTRAVHQKQENSKTRKTWGSTLSIFGGGSLVWFGQPLLSAGPSAL